MSSRRRWKPPRKFYKKVKEDTATELLVLNAEKKYSTEPRDESCPIPASAVEPSTSHNLCEESSNSDENSSNCSEVGHEEELEDTQQFTKKTKEGSDKNNSSYSEWSLETFKKDLVDWAIEGNIAHSNLSKLLNILKKHNDFEKLPVDARSLLKTPRETNIERMCGGSFVYFGVAEGVRNILKSESNLPDNIELLVSVDGLPISKSSGSQLWPQLGKIRSLPQSPVFAIGIFHGYQKPNDSNVYLSHLVEELKLCSQHGIMLNDKIINLSHVAFVCDAPAKSFILQTKGHTGYFSCTRCKDEGQYMNGRISFSEISGPIRINEEFLNQEHEEYHVGKSILVEIPNFDTVHDIPLEYMHLVCLGVVKKILNLWMRGSLTYRLSNSQLCRINKILKYFRRYTPSDFARKPRGLDELARWKATELRFFLLYAGPVLLAREKCIRPEIAENFLTLSMAINILLDPSKCNELQDYAKSLLETFVVNFKKLYGQHLISHNIHGLLHLSDDVSTFGSLENCSAFPFENFMQTLKSFMRKHHVPLQQICKRLQEKRHSRPKLEAARLEQEYRNNHESGPLIGQCTNPQFKILQTKHFKLTCADKDGFCMLHNQQIVRVKNFAFSPENNEIVMICEQYESVQDLFERPFKSSKLNIFVIEKKCKDLKVCRVSDVEKKIVIFPFKSMLAAIPLNHC